MAEVEANITENDLTKFTLSMLKTILSQFQLNRKGNKATLIQRIPDHVKSDRFGQEMIGPPNSENIEEIVENSVESSVSRSKITSCLKEVILN